MSFQLQIMFLDYIISSKWIENLATTDFCYLYELSLSLYIYTYSMGVLVKFPIKLYFSNVRLL